VGKILSRGPWERNTRIAAPVVGAPEHPDGLRAKEAVVNEAAGILTVAPGPSSSPFPAAGMTINAIHQPSSARQEHPLYELAHAGPSSR
jgi:hypothetical protein